MAANVAGIIRTFFKKNTSTGTTEMLNTMEVVQVPAKVTGNGAAGVKIYVISGNFKVNGLPWDLNYLSIVTALNISEDVEDKTIYNLTV